MVDAAKLDAGRRLSRRYMAWGSFVFLILAGLVVVGALVFHKDRADIAMALSIGAVAFVSVMGIPASILGAYLGISLKEALTRGAK